MNRRTLVAVLKRQARGRQAGGLENCEAPLRHPSARPDALVDPLHDRGLLAS